jgi:hypothetical protein
MRRTFICHCVWRCPIIPCPLLSQSTNFEDIKKMSFGKFQKINDFCEIIYTLFPCFDQYMLVKRSWLDAQRRKVHNIYNVKSVKLNTCTWVTLKYSFLPLGYFKIFHPSSSKQYDVFCDYICSYSWKNRSLSLVEYCFRIFILLISPLAYRECIFITVYLLYIYHRLFKPVYIYFHFRMVIISWT